jgi:hypothetical protein
MTEGLMESLPWARWSWQACTARRERRPDVPYFGRCELRRNHDGDHALERGMDIPRWSTDWSDVPAPNGIDWRSIAGELVEAIRLTREYVGEESLPAVPGWSWFDATQHFDAADRVTR